MKEVDFSVMSQAPNVQETRCCLICLSYLDNAPDRVSDIRCKKHHHYFTKPHWVCDDFTKMEG